MNIGFRWMLGLLFAMVVLPLTAQDVSMESKSPNLSQESVEYLATRPADAQTQMTQMIRSALEGDLASLDQVRSTASPETPPPMGVRVENTTAAGRNIRFYLPEEKPTTSIVLYLHGGGWTLGSVDGSSRFCGNLAQKASMDVATLDYRLAPEYRAPAALDDVLATIQCLRERGYVRIYLSGDSAGGNLAACAALKLRSRIAGTILYYPVVLAKNDASSSWKAFGQRFGLDGALMEAFNESYAPGGWADDPMVSPLLATEFEHYPTTLIVAAECDILYDQGEKFAMTLKRAGVSVEHITIPGTLHAFMTYPKMEQAYQSGLQQAVDFLHRMEQTNMNTVTSESIVRLSRVTVDPAQLSEYLTFATECGEHSMAEEPGVLMMYSMADKKQPNLITILEIYVDQPAYDAHIQTSHFLKYKRGTLQMVQKLELLDQIPLIPNMKMK